MISIYEQGYNDFSSNGLGTLSPSRCLVREEQGGRYELELEHPMDDGGLYDLLKNGRIIKAPVPAQTTPMHRIKGVADKEYWTASSRKNLYSAKSTNTGYMETVTRTKQVLTEHVLPRVAASHALGLEYVGNHPRDTGTIYKKKPVSYTEYVWVPGPSRILTSIPPGEEFLVLDKSDANWLQVAAKNGTEGFIQRAGCAHSRTVPGVPDEVVQEKKIRDQLFRIYRTEKDTDAGEVKAWARHIYYDLLGNVLMDALYETVDLEELLPQLEVNCSQPDHGFRFFTDEPSLEVNDLDYTHKNMVEAHLDPEEGLLKKSNLRLVRDNFSVYFTGRSQKVRAPITYGRNLLGVSLEINEDAVVNRIIPLGQDKDGEPVLLDEKWVDSPNLQEGDIIRAKAIEYSEAREKDPTEATENSPGDPGMSIPQVKEKLLELALEEYEKGIDLPEIELEVDFLQLGDTEEYAQYRELDRLYLSDLTQITDLTHGIDVEAEVTEYEYDCLTKRYTKIKVGVTSAGRTIGSVDGFMLPSGGVAGTKIARGGVDASRLQNLSITSAKIGVAQIQQAHIQDAAIDTAQIKNAAITTAKIGDAQVDTAQIKDAAIQTAKIGDLQVSNAKIANGTIETAKIKDAAITTAKIQDAQITNAKIAAAGIDFANIKDVVAGTGIFRQGVGDALYLDRLVVNDANFASAIAGKLMIRDTDGKLYRISVNSSGEVTATQVQVNGDSLTDNAVMSVSQRLLWRQATQPSAPWVGMLWLDTTTEKLKRCTAITPSVAWEVVPAGEVHTAVIDVDDNGMNILSGGNLNLLSGGNLNIKNLGDTGNVINMDSTGLTLSSTGQINVASGGKINLTTPNDLVLGTQNITAFADGRIDAKASTIDLSANNSIKLVVSNVRVGGTNLIINSHFDINDSAGWVPRYSTITVFNSVLHNTFSEVHGSARLERIVDVPAPGTYTYTIFASTPQAIVWSAFEGASVLSFTDTAASASYKVYSVIFQAFSAGPVTIRGYFGNAPVGSVVNIDWETLRSGNVSSGWDAGQADRAAYEYNHLVDSHFNGGSANGWSTLYGPVTVANSLLTKTIDTSISATRIEKTLQIPKGGLYTFTIYAKTPQPINWNSFVNAGIVAQSDGAASPSTFKKYSVTFFTAADNLTVTLRAYMPNAPVGSTVVIDWEKLQLGAVATDWSDHYLDPASGVKTSKVTIDGTGIAMTTGGTFTTTSQNFNIDAAGNVTMKGQVEAASGKIGGFTISGNKLVDTATGGTKAQFDPTTGSLILNDLEITQESDRINFLSRFVSKLRYFDFSNPNGGFIFRSSSPADPSWMTRFDVEMPTAAKPDGRTYNYGDSYIDGNCSAQSFTDRTPAYFGDALDELRWSRASKGGIDHKSLPKFAQKTIIGTRINEDGEKEDYQEEGRDLGAMVSVLTRAVQQLADKVDSQQRLIEDLNRRVSA